MPDLAPDEIMFAFINFHQVNIFLSTLLHYHLPCFIVYIILVYIIPSHLFAVCRLLTVFLL